MSSLGSWSRHRNRPLLRRDRIDHSAPPEFAFLIEAYEKEHGVIEASKLADMKLKTFIPRAKALLARAAKEENVKILIDFAKKYASTDNEPEVMAAVAALTAVVKGTRVVLSKNGKATPRGVISELFVNVGDTASESDVFAKFRMGRGEMKGAIKLALKDPANHKGLLAKRNGVTLFCMQTCKHGRIYPNSSLLWP